MTGYDTSPAPARSPPVPPSVTFHFRVSVLTRGAPRAWLPSWTGSIWYVTASDPARATEIATAAEALGANEVLPPQRVTICRVPGASAAVLRVAVPLTSFEVAR